MYTIESLSIVKNMFLLPFLKVSYSDAKLFFNPNRQIQ